MLEINNVNFEKETVETGEFDPDKQELLMNVLELNEKLNDVRSSDQVAEFEAELAGILKPLKRELNAAFVAGDLKQAVNVISKMKYFQNIDERFQELKLELTLTGRYFDGIDYNPGINDFLFLLIKHAKPIVLSTN
jgi:DnaJ-domain-containing protein 1